MNVYLSRFALITVLLSSLVACGQPATEPRRPVAEPPGEAAPDPAPPVALQLYTLRDYGTLDEQLALAAETGFVGVELYQTYDLSAEALAQKVASYGLEITSQHVNLGDLRYSLENVMSYGRALGVDTVILPWLSDEERPRGAAGWLELGRELDGYGRALGEAGFTLGYHNHDFEMKDVEGKPALAWLFEGASAERVKWQPDVAWVRIGGQDPATLLHTYRDRVVSMHAKDVAEDRGSEGGFADVGYGTLDWADILGAAAETPLEWYIVEHDQPSDHARSVTRSFDYLSDHLEAAERGEAATP